jgi:hypothetical protein
VHEAVFGLAATMNGASTCRIRSPPPAAASPFLKPWKNTSNDMAEISHPEQRDHAADSQM